MEYIDRILSRMQPAARRLSAPGATAAAAGNGAATIDKALNRIANVVDADVNPSGGSQ
jgi:hypothetical protein